MAVVAVALTLISGHGFRPDLSAAAGFPVRCHPVAQYGYDSTVAGVALVDRQEIVLVPQICRDFDRGGMWTVGAVGTLAHERQHLLGVSDELETDCEAIWDMRRLGRRLGYRISRTDVFRYAGRFYRSCVR